MPVLKMSIRWKYFLSITALCLLPLLAVTIVGQHGISQLEKTVSDDTREAFAEISSRALLQTAQIQATMLKRTQQTVEFSLQVLANDVRLALALPEDQLHETNLPEEEDSVQAWDFPTDPVAWVKRPPSPSAPNNQYPFYIVGPEVETQNTGAELTRLASLTHRLVDIHQQMPDLVVESYLGLESGVHAFFPRRSTHTQDMEPRKELWHIKTRTHKNADTRVLWSVPTEQEGKNKAMFMASRALVGQDGAIIGVAAMEINAAANLAQNGLSAPWKSDMRAFLTQCTDSEGQAAFGLQILAEKNSTKDPWTGVEDIRWLESEDTAGFHSMMTAITQGVAGTEELPFQGESCIWAWAPLGEGHCFVTLLPTSVVGGKAREVATTLDQYTDTALLYSLLAALGALILALTAAFLGSRAFTRPLIELMRGVSRVSKGDFSVRVATKTGNEWDRLIRGFNEMVPMLEETMSWRKKLDLAREVQQSLMPKSAPLVPGLDVAGKNVSADRVGGDYFDFLTPKQENRLIVAVGDITGHGVGAALLMATARALVRRRSKRPGSLAKIMGDINKQLAPDVANSGKFMTFFLAELDVGRRVVRWANGGHDPALVYDPTNNHFERLEGGGLILGPFEDSVYEQYKCPLNPGNILVIGTDGIWETQSPEGEMFGKDRLKTIIASHSHLPARDMVDAVFQAVDQFRTPQPQEDDITLVIVKVQDISLDGQTKEYKQLKFKDFL